MSAAVLTVDGGGQQRGHDLRLALLVLVQETLEAVEHRAAEHERLPLVHHGHEQHHDGRSAGNTEQKLTARLPARELPVRRLTWGGLRGR